MLLRLLFALMDPFAALTVFEQSFVMTAVLPQAQLFLALSL